jgi:hypothetical protein
MSGFSIFIVDHWAAISASITAAGALSRRRPPPPDARSLRSAPRAERSARPRQDGDANVPVFANPVQAIHKGAAHLLVYGIALSRTIERDDGHVALELEQQGIAAHTVAPFL